MKVLLYLASRMGIRDIIKIVPDVPDDASDKYIQSLFNTKMGIKYDSRNCAYVILPKFNKSNYQEIRADIKASFPRWKKDLCNDVLLISKHSEKL